MDNNGDSSFWSWLIEQWKEMFLEHSRFWCLAFAAGAIFFIWAGVVWMPWNREIFSSFSAVMACFAIWLAFKARR